MSDVREPVWVSRGAVEAIQFDQIREHGGLPGVRDENALEAALARPRHKWAYEQTDDVATLAAAYAYGISHSHPFRDGNKRIAFMTMYTFLGLNGHDLEADEADVVVTILALADNRLSEEQLTAWVTTRITPRSPDAV